MFKTISLTKHILFMRRIHSLLIGFFFSLILLQAKAQNNEFANFTTTSTGTTVHFTNTSNTPPGDTAMRRCLWLFGDGSSLLTYYSTNPIHTYAQYGTYQACLKLFKRVPPTTPSGDTLLLLSSICKSIQLSSADSCSANFEMLSTTSNPLGKYFIAQPWHNNQKKPEQICWTFGDGRDTCINYDPNQPPPNAYAVFHQYNQPGTYVVCVTIRYQGGCVAHLCKTLQIGDPATCTANFEINQPNSTPFGKTFTAIPGHSQNKKPVKICWNFGDGRDTCINYLTTFTGPYTVFHNYQQPGNYNVCLKIFYDGGCEAYHCRSIIIAAPDSCTANFEMLSTASNPLGKYFKAQPWHNNQKKPEQVCWTFGDGRDTCINYDPNQPPPNAYAVFHQYNQPGTYVVCVTIRYQGGCVAHLCKTLQIGDPATCTANFEINQPNSTPFGKTFTAIPGHSQNKKPVKICWNFGDGRDTCINYLTTFTGPYTVFHNYQQPGNYNVCVKIFYDGGCEAYHCHSILVAAPDSCTANFETVNTSTSLLTQHFVAIPGHSTQKKPVYICWEFGDGSDTCIQYPILFPGSYTVTHTYAMPGQYNVCVRIVYQGGCEARRCKPVTIPNPPLTCTAQLFQITPSITSLIRGLYVVANSTPTRPIIKICWYFGDGSDTCIYPSATAPSPYYFINHTYPGPGVYHPCVKVYFDGGCIAQSCIEVVIQSNNGVCGGYITDSISGPRTIKFKGFSIHSPGDNVLSYQWYFGDGSGAFGQNVIHTYNQPGIYQVCLLIKTQRGCETRICKRIIIDGPNTPVLQLTPNPVINILHAVFNSTHTETATIRILNSSGSAVRTYTRNLTTGINQWDFDLTGLVQGIYSFVIQSPNQQASAIFIKI